MGIKTPGRTALLASVFAIAAGCREQVATPALLVDAPSCQCSTAALSKVAALRVELSGLVERKSACIDLAGATLGELSDLQGLLRGAVSLEGLASGTYTLVVIGYGDAKCQSGVAACGRGRFALPAIGGLRLPVYCLNSAQLQPVLFSPNSCRQDDAPAQCVARAWQPDGGLGDSGPKDGALGDGGSADLLRPSLSDHASCTSARMDNVQSSKIAVYQANAMSTPVDFVCLNHSGALSAPADLIKDHKSIVLAGLAAGSWRLVVTGHDNDNCKDDDIVLCAGETIALPASQGASLTPQCVDDTVGSVLTRSACLALLFP